MRKIINCLKCEFFYVSWDPKFPRGCRFYGFKSKQLPSITVEQSTGSSCQVFSPKEKS